MCKEVESLEKIGQVKYHHGNMEEAQQNKLIKHQRLVCRKTLEKFSSKKKLKTPQTLG